MSYPVQGAANNTPVPAPDYNPANWKLGYQTSQFGVGSSSAETPQSTTTPMPPGSVYAALANPPRNMSIGVGQPLPPQGFGDIGEQTTSAETPDIYGGTPSTMTYPAGDITGGTP